MHFKLKKRTLEDGSITYHPYVKVTISHLNKSKEVTAVLDTGADLIYIPKESPLKYKSIVKTIIFGLALTYFNGVSTKYLLQD